MQVTPQYVVLIEVSQESKGVFEMRKFKSGNVVRRSRSLLLLALLVGFGLVGMGVREARASGGNSILVSFIGSVPLGGGLFGWDYSATGVDGVVLADQRRIETGDFFTIYDFVGVDVPGTFAAATPASWSVLSIAPVGLTPPAIAPLPGDDPTITNVTWVYSGPTTAYPGAPGALLFGTFRIVTNVAATAASIGIDFYSAQDTIAGGPLTGTKDQNVGTLAVNKGVVPVSGAHTAMIGMLGGGLFWLRSRKTTLKK
jgi:hypothetical protein